MSIDPAVTEELRDVLATVAAVPVTPFGPDGAPDWDCHGRLIRRLIDNGITLVTPNGNTGEFYTLSAEETRAATESAIRAARGRAEVLAGVGHDLPTAISSASHARAAGARMIMIHQPVSPYLSAEGWVDYHAAIAETVPDLGVVLYIRDPRIAGRHIRELGRRSPNVVGVKYGVKDMVQFAGVARDAGAGPVHLAGRAGRADRARLLGVRRPGLHLRAGQRRPAAVARPAGLAAQRRPRRRPAGLERLPEVRGAARGRLVGGQRQRGQGGPGPAGAGPPGRPSAQPPAAGPGAGGNQQDPGRLGAARRGRPAVSTSAPDGESRSPEQLRSYGWFGGDGMRAFSHGTRMRQMGADPADYEGKPIIAIVNTWSELNPCHMHLRERAEHVKRGIWEAGGFPAEFGVASLSETFQKPTPMLYRNLLAMDTEELLRSYPADGAVLMGGCDKTTPALIMGAASAGIPAIYLPAGPMLRGNYRGTTLGSGTDLWKYWDDKRAGLIGDCEMADLAGGIARSPGHCMTMGTASTMTSAAEALGMTLPGAASIPAVDSAHYRMATATGRRIVDMAWEHLTPDRILTAEAFEDAVATVLALGGSTNAVIHLIAMAGRCGVPLSLDDFDDIARRVPVLANVRPGGKYLMEDFYYAGGLRALLARLAEVPGALHTDRITVTGRPLAEQLAGAQVYNDDVIREPGTALAAEAGLAVLRGNLAPDGAVIKHIAAESALLKHTGPAVVFDSYREMQRQINDPALGVTADSVLVLRNAGPLGGPGMPEYGMLPIPDYLLAQGVRDMVRISDARMSGTSYGACVLHIAPESYVGGPLALVRTGDLITLDVAERSLRLEVDDAELARRRAAWQPPPRRFERGYGALYAEQVTQADKGCDFEFLARPGRNPEPDPH